MKIYGRTFTFKFLNCHINLMAAVNRKFFAALDPSSTRDERSSFDRKLSS